MKNKLRVEFTYDPIFKRTLCIVWNGMRIHYAETINGKLSKDNKNKFKKEHT